VRASGVSYLGMCGHRVKYVSRSPEAASDTCPSTPRRIACFRLPRPPLSM
jgi:hypothetical protein